MNVTPQPALFVNEHVTAPENRLNLGLFALLNVPAFRGWFLQRLQLPAGTVVYPPQNVAGCRPDLVAVAPGGEVLCWIEIELGPPDAAQLQAYRKAFAERVICIAGAPDGDVTLGEIAQEVSRIQPEMDDQATRSAHVVLDLIKLLAGKAQAWNYAEPDDSLRGQPLVAALLDRLPDRLIFGSPPLPPGKIVLSTITQKGWTLRVYSHKATTNHSLSVMWNPAVGRGVVRVPSRIRLNRYLPNGSGASEYGDWLAEAFDAGVATLRERQSAPVQELALLERADDLAAQLRELSVAG